MHAVVFYNILYVHTNLVLINPQWPCFLRVEIPLLIFVFLEPADILHCIMRMAKSKKVALGVPGRLRPRIISTFGITRVVGRQPYAPAAFTPGETPGSHFQRLSRPQGTWFCRKEPRKKSPVTPPGIDPGTVRPVAQRLNHYATPDPSWEWYSS